MVETVYSFRVEKSLLDSAKKAADALDITLAQICRQCLRAYVRENAQMDLIERKGRKSHAKQG